MSRTDRRADIPWDEIREQVEQAREDHAQTLVVYLHIPPARGRKPVVFDLREARRVESTRETMGGEG